MRPQHPMISSTDALYDSMHLQMLSQAACAFHTVRQQLVLRKHRIPW